MEFKLGAEEHLVVTKNGSSNNLDELDLKLSTTITSGQNSYTVQQLLTALAGLMDKNLITQT